MGNSSEARVAHERDWVCYFACLCSCPRLVGPGARSYFAAPTAWVVAKPERSCGVLSEAEHAVGASTCLAPSGQTLNPYGVTGTAVPASIAERSSCSSPFGGTALAPKGLKAKMAFAKAKVSGTAAAHRS